MEMSIPWKRAAFGVVSVEFVRAWPLVRKGGFGRLRRPGCLRALVVLGWLVIAR